MIIVYCDKGPGWTPITYMVKLAARLLEAELLIIEHKKQNFIGKLIAALLKRRVVDEGEDLLLICPSAPEMSLLLQIPNFRSRFKFISAWVIDSFWIDRIPKFVKSSNYFDHIFVTTEEDVTDWEGLTNTPVTWLPWGSDVLNLGGSMSIRDCDLLRVGRQPPEWDSDELTHKTCTENGIVFRGRPDIHHDPSMNQKALMSKYMQTKMLLAFSNLANPANYTHPSRSYLTGRWVDALACGAVVAGISPNEPSINRLLWEGATLDFGTIKLNDGIEVIKKALSNWSPSQAEHNYRKSLERLDWRWRFVEITNVFKITPKLLFKEITLLKLKISETSRNDLHDE